MKLQTKPALRIILNNLATSFGISVNHVRVLLALERIVARSEYSDSGVALCANKNCPATGSKISLGLYSKPR